MQDEQQNIVDIYIPRKCSATNRLITAKDHASVQIEIAEVSQTHPPTHSFSLHHQPTLPTQSLHSLLAWVILKSVSLQIANHM